MSLFRSRIAFSLVKGSFLRRTFATSKRGLVERLDAGETILCAEGYLLALSRRGYIAHGVWVPEFMLEQPEVLKSLHYEMHHAGSDVMEAFQVFYNKRERLSLSIYTCSTTHIVRR